jgi:hypothetical protein
LLNSSCLRFSRVESKRVHEEFPCPHCSVKLTKGRLQRLYEARFDPAINEQVRAPKRRPMLINYSVGGNKYEKEPTAGDLALVDRILAVPLPAEVPVHKLPYMHMTHERAHMDAAGVTHVHHFFLPRQAQVMTFAWRKTTSIKDSRLRNMLRWFLDHAIWGMSILNRYKPIQYGRPGGSQVNNYLDGVYYVPAQIVECSPWYNLAPRAKRLPEAFSADSARLRGVVVDTGTCSQLSIPDDSVDYIFTDPPFGENKYYADLNYLVESWHGVLTDADPEAIVDRAKKIDCGIPESDARVP